MVSRIRLKQSLLLPFFVVVFFIVASPIEAATTISFTTLPPGTTTWTKADGPYLATRVFVPSGATLVIEPGTIVKLNGDYALYSSGTIIIGAADSERTMLTSLHDDSLGGDTDRNGSTIAPHPGDWCAIGVLPGSTLSVTNTNIRYGGCPNYGQIYNMGGEVTITDVRFSDASHTDFRQEAGTAVITHSEITGARYGLHFWNGTVTLHGNDIHDNAEYGVINTSSGTVIDASGNWWGSDAGPFHPVLNPGGLGNNAVSDYITVDPWLRTNPLESIPLCTENCFSNILFLPGLEASRLYHTTGSGEDQLWEPGSDSDVGSLFMDDFGKSIRNGIYTRDVLDNAYVPIKGNVYKSFLADLAAWKNDEHLIEDYVAAPYDWRLTFKDILDGGEKTGDDISYLAPTDTPYILSELRRLARTSKSGKVTVIAHSNGGLLAKALTDRLGAEASQLIDKLVFVAVPQSGTPQAIGALLHGYDQGLPVDWFPFAMNPRTARTMANNMPSAYHLLPSGDYFSGDGSSVSTPVITFDPGPATDYYIDAFGKKIDTLSELDGFLGENEGKAAPDSNALATPSTINSGLLSESEVVRQELDNWTVPAGISLYQIGGFGEETVGTIRYWSGEECLHEGGAICSSRVPKLEYTPELMVDGDGTVVAPSALAMSSGISGVYRWWVDLDKYNNEIPVSLTRFDSKHANVLEISELRDFIVDNILTGTFTSLPKYISESRPASLPNTRRLRYFLHSPLALSARDSDGHSISATEDTYPDATYRRFGEVQYISVPAESAPTIVMDGLATGSFTLEIEEVIGETVEEKMIFSAIPTSAETEVTMEFPDGTIVGADPLMVDYDGDGTTDYALPSAPGETVTLDMAPPTTTASFSGSEGMNGWYTGPVLVTLSASDDIGGSGIAETRYSLDDGVTWQLYTTPFSVGREGVTTLRYYSADKQGNKEDTKSQSIRIDTVAPEAQIALDPVTQKLSVMGVDNLGGSVAVVIIEGQRDITSTNPQLKTIKPWFNQWFKKKKKDLPDMLAILTDEAGHTTSITFEKTKDQKGDLFVRVRALGYDESETRIDKTKAEYRWQLDEKKEYRKLISYLESVSSRLETRYVQKDNETWIMDRPREFTDDDRDDELEHSAIKKLPGMVIPYFMTELGKINIKY